VQNYRKSNTNPQFLLPEKITLDKYPIQQNNSLIFLRGLTIDYAKIKPRFSEAMVDILSLCLNFGIFPGTGSCSEKTYVQRERKVFA